MVIQRCFASYTSTTYSRVLAAVSTFRSRSKGAVQLFVSSYKMALSVPTLPKRFLSGVLLFDFVFAPLRQNICRVEIQLNSYSRQFTIKFARMGFGWSKFAPLKPVLVVVCHLLYAFFTIFFAPLHQNI